MTIPSQGGSPEQPWHPGPAGPPQQYGAPPYPQQPGYPLPGGYPQSGYQYSPAYQNPYGQFGYPSPGYGQQGLPTSGYTGELATWGRRAAASLLDYLIYHLVPIIVTIIGWTMLIHSISTCTSTSDSSASTTNTATDSICGFSLAGLGWMAAGAVLNLALTLWRLWQQGKTGASLGKKVVGIKVVYENTLAPIGFGMSIVRELAHILDALPCYVGFLVPLWDAKRQTFADKVVRTLVIPSYTELHT